VIWPRNTANTDIKPTTSIQPATKQSVAKRILLCQEDLTDLVTEAAVM
jgi:hypothetical protein